MNDLCHDANIIVKPADKNLGLTLIAREWYIAECERQLKDTSTYTKVHNVSLSGIQNRMLHFIATLKGKIPPNEHKWLTRETERLRPIAAVLHHAQASQESSEGAPYRGFSQLEYLAPL